MVTDTDIRKLARRGHQGDPEEAARARRAGLRAEGLPSDLTPEQVLLGSLMGDARCENLVAASGRCVRCATEDEDGLCANCANADGTPMRWLRTLEHLAGGVLTGRRVACVPAQGLVRCRLCLKWKNPPKHDPEGRLANCDCVGYALPPVAPGCSACDGSGEVLATEECLISRSMPELGHTEHCECRGTKRRPETLRTRLLVRVAAACAEAVVVHYTRFGLSAEWHLHAGEIIAASRAADAWALDPSDERRQRWLDTWPDAALSIGLGPDVWVPSPGDEPQELAERIRAAAREVGEAACVEAAQGLAPWVLGEGA